MTAIRGELWLCCALAFGCATHGGATNPCPAQVAVGQTIACQCSAGGPGTQTCQTNSTLSECTCIGSGLAADGGGGTSGGHAGAGAGGGSGSLAFDAATHDAGGGGRSDGGLVHDGGGMHHDAGPPPPPTDGTQGAACSSKYPCQGSLHCYMPGSAIVGSCTKSCNNAAQCNSLTGANYSCSSTGVFGGGGSCRITCTGASDSSCPANMLCKASSGGMGGGGTSFECVYDDKSLGSRSVELWGKCDTSADCAGNLLCFGRGTMMVAGTTYQGFCTQPCKQTSDCTQKPAEGGIAPTCGSDGKCQLACGGLASCPSAMRCITDVAIAAQRCVYAM